MSVQRLSLILSLLLSLAGCQRHPARLIFLQVGQGDCAVFSTAGSTIMVDAGPREGGFDSGERIILPALRRLGIQSVDLILLSHPDLDHVGGLGAICRAMPNARVAASAEFRTWPSMIRSLKEAHIDPGDVVWLPRDSVAKLGRFQLRLYCPSMEGRENDNDGSMCVRISDGHQSAVLTGDAPSEIEEELAQHGNWRADILKAGHHGSRGSTSYPWLRAVGPRWVILSCGRDNRFGHPHKETMDRIREYGAEPLRTDQLGDIEFDAGNQGWQRAN